MKTLYLNVLRYSIGGMTGFALVVMGVHWSTWQFWAILIPIAIAVNLFLDRYEE